MAIADDHDRSFDADAQGLRRAVDLLLASPTNGAYNDQSSFHQVDLPMEGCGEASALEALAPFVLGQAARLGRRDAMAHMDPPTPWITWATALWNASLNQNLLHPDTAPFARKAEELVMAWLAPAFGMAGGHMTAGSTLANLTALWAARDICGVSSVVAGDTAHLSVAKSAKILGMSFTTLPTDAVGRLRRDCLPDNLDRSILVLTAGTTATGVVDPLSLAGRAVWTHIDAAWAGPLRLSDRHSNILAGIEQADSISISAHKWLFQPKDSALVLFRDPARAHAAVGASSSYLAVPNIGVMGSRGAACIPLLATFLAWGKHGVAARIDKCMAIADQLASRIADDDRLQLLARPETGVVIWRPREVSSEVLQNSIPLGATSLATVAGERWIRNVCANPNADADAIYATIDATLAVHTERAVPTNEF